MSRLALFAMIAALLAGCSTLSAIGSATTPLDAYELRAPTDGPRARSRPQGRDLIIETPAARGALDTDRILVRPNPLQAQYLPRARWSDPAPVMMQTLMLHSIENAEALRFVGRQPLGGSGDFALVSELTEFEAEVDDVAGTAVIRIHLRARIVREADASIVATRSFTARLPAPSLETPALIATFNAAAQTLLKELTGWTLATLGIRTAAAQ